MKSFGRWLEDKHLTRSLSCLPTSTEGLKIPEKNPRQEKELGERQWYYAAFKTKHFQSETQARRNLEIAILKKRNKVERPRDFKSYYRTLEDKTIW